MAQLIYEAIKQLELFKSGFCSWLHVCTCMESNFGASLKSWILECLIKGYNNSYLYLLRDVEGV